MRVLLVLALVVAVTAYQASDFTGTCQSGKKQSPINIQREKTQCVRAGTIEAVQHKIDFFYWKRWAHALEMANNGHTLKVLHSFVLLASLVTHSRVKHKSSLYDLQPTACLFVVLLLRFAFHRFDRMWVL